MYPVQDNQRRPLRNIARSSMEALEMMKNAAKDSPHALKIKIQIRVLMQILMRFIRPTDTNLYLPELSHHAVVVAFLSCVVFISLDNISSILNDDDNIYVWGSLHLCLFGFFYFFMHPWVEFFSRPLIGKPSYASFNMWHVSWLLIAAVDHSMGESMRMNLFLFGTIFALSILCRHLFLSLNALVVAFLICVVFISLDNISSILNDEDNIHVWWSLHLCLFGFFYFFMHPWVLEFFSQPLIGEPSYASFNKWYVSWLLIAAVDHSMGESMRMNLSLFGTIFALSILCLLLFHTIFYGFRYIFSREVRKWPEIYWTMLQLSAVVSIACCIFLSKCKERPRGPRAFTDQVCSYLIVPDVGSEISDHHYPKFFSGVLPAKVSTDEMHALYSLWATFIGLYIANCIAERLPASGEEYEKNKIMKPDFLDMVPWYSGTSVDLYKTAFNIIVSVNIFLGRFDIRESQAAAMNRVGGVPKNRTNGQDDDGDFLYEVHTEKKELWFDFMADTGDGGNSTYTVARLLAQPSIDLEDSELGKLTLNRGDLLLIGGDLAYPNPSQFTYESRLFRPFEYALQSRSCAEQARTVVDKPKAPHEVSESWKQGRKRSKKHRRKQVKPYEGPQCFLIPGNHDWFDGLHTFMGYICRRCWLGGWFMPQRKSYFALKLPKGWWVFGLDLALHGDIDAYQFEFFSKLARKKVGETDSVIVMTHQPDWLLDWYENGEHKHNISDLICNILKRRCRLRIAGDIHHYMRHERVNSGGGSDHELGYAQHLLVNGCGGAFLHPTHVFRNFNKSHEVSYECKQAYPTFEKSRKLAWKNISKFRKQNWRFDFIGGILYFILVFSMFPQCELGTVWSALMYMVHHSYVSLGGSVLFLMAAIAFTPSERSWTTRIVIGFCHFSAHLVVALILMLVFELGVETFVRIGLLETSEYHSLYRSLESMLIQPASNGNRTTLEQWTFGLYPACIKYVMSAFDVPELIAVTRRKICENGMESLSRVATIVYYVSVFLYFWVLSTPAVSLVFGCYLYVCVNWFNLHYDEAFSSLRIANYKAFTRFHIKPNGDLQVFTLAVDKVPEDWELHPQWKQESAELSYRREFPSKWRATASYQDPLDSVHIIDHFVIQRQDRPNN